jgi:hypothetical protein
MISQQVPQQIFFNLARQDSKTHATIVFFWTTVPVDKEHQGALRPLY